MQYLFHGSTIFQGKIKAHINTEAKLLPSGHALRATTDDRYGSFVLPTSIPSRYEIVELEQRNGVDSKYVLRFIYDQHRDICIVIRPNGYDYVIVTAWLNKCDDNHSTLNKKRYNLPELVKY